MKRRIFKFIGLILVISISFETFFMVIDASGASLEINPTFGQAPTIDGEIKNSDNEWDKAVKKNLILYQNLTRKLNGNPIDIWVMQNSSNLYIAIQFNFNHEEYEFMGIEISEDESESPQAFKDSKLIEFINISTSEYNYKDYYINDSIYYEDSNYNGNGAGKIDLGNGDVVYEFVIPLELEDPQDVFLEYGSTYAFKIFMGYSTMYPPSYPEDITLYNIILIEVSYIFPTPLTPLEIFYLVLSIIIFSTVGAFYIFYIYRIVKLKEKIEKIRT